MFIKVISWGHCGKITKSQEKQKKSWYQLPCCGGGLSYARRQVHTHIFFFYNFRLLLFIYFYIFFFLKKII